MKKQKGQVFGERPHERLVRLPLSIYYFMTILNDRTENALKYPNAPLVKFEIGFAGVAVGP